MNSIFEELNKNKEVVSFHVPGHKNGKLFNKLGYDLNELSKLDSTEIIGTDNLFNADGIIKESMDRCSKVFGSDKSYFLTNGTTCGIYSAIMGGCDLKDKVIVNRDCHQSVINASILGDIDLVYGFCDINENLSTVLNVENFINLIEDNKDAKAILVTYPTYYGQTFDLERICKKAHENNMIVIVDEAHGAHLGLSEYLPKTALSLGADIVIQSTHKTLTSFTQSSIMHIKSDKVDFNRIENFLRIFQSSSPSYLLMTSLEISVDIYDKYGKELMKKLINEIDYFKEHFVDNSNISIQNEYDKTKIFVKIDSICGYDLEKILRFEYDIQVELSNYYGVLLVSSIGNDVYDFLKLKNALISIIKDNKNGEILDIDLEKLKCGLKNIPTKKFLLKESFYKIKKSVKIEDSINEVCGEFVIPYPPGVSIISPGEIITQEIIDTIMFYKKFNFSINGMKDSNLEYIEVIV